MPNPALATYNSDGGLAFGSQDVTINSVVYTAEEFSLQFGSDWTVTNNSVAVPNKQFGRQTVPTGTITLQLAATTTAVPPMFTEFTAVSQGAVSYTLIVAGVNPSQTNGDVRKLTIDVRYKLN